MPTVTARKEEDPTMFWTEAETANVRAAAEAGGAHRSPQATPRAALLVAVAPPASAPALPPFEATLVKCRGAEVR